MQEHFDVEKARLVFVSGANAGKPVPFDRDEINLENMASIHRIQGVFLLKSLTEKEILVSGEPVQEKILEWGDRISCGSVDLEFKAAEGEASAALLRRQRQLRIVIIILTFATLALMALNKFMPQARRTAGLAPPPASTPLARVPAAKPPKNGSSQPMVERIAEARLRFEIANRFYSDSHADDTNLYSAILVWQQMIDDLQDIQPEPGIRILGRERLTQAQTDLVQKVEFLKTNAYIALQLGDNDDLRNVLQRILVTVPDPMNKDYQWAQAKLLSIPVE